MVRKIYILILFVILYSTVHAQSISVEASTDTTDYLVGDYINYTLKITYDKSLKIQIPPVEKNLSSLVKLKELPSEKLETGNQITEIHHYILAGYDSLSINVPEMPVEYFEPGGKETKIAKSNPVKITVHTLAVDPKKEIKDIKPPLRIEVSWLLYLLILVLILLVALIAYYIYTKYFKKQKPQEISQEEIILTPYRLALKQLHELEEKKLWQQGKVKEYHTELTGIIRQYFEDRYHFPAKEMTSSEIIKVTNRVMDSPPIIKITEEFFRNADLVKFAKFIPMPSINEEMMKQAYKIIERTRPASEEEKRIGEVEHVR